MIDDLASYALSDFLMFSQETYFRLFEQYNRDVWPMPLLALALAVALLWLMRRRQVGRTASAILTLAWIWVGWAFHLERYATINLAAPYFASLFSVEALLLLAIGVAAGRLGPLEGDAFAARAGQGLVLFAVFLSPVVGLLAGRTWMQVSLFGMGPDPTALATIGVLLASAGRLRWLLLLPPVLWCAITLLTALAMQSLEAIPSAVGFVAVVVVAIRQLAAVWRRSRASMRNH